MRPGQKNRGRGGRGGMGGGYNPNRQGGGGRPPNRSQNFDSSGPSVKIRGNAYQVFERYIAMAREAASAGDRVAAENLYQHAEHYYRIMQTNGENQGQQGQRPMTPADNEMTGGHEDGEGHPGGPPPAMQPQHQQHQSQPQHQQHQQHQPQQPQHQQQHQHQPPPHQAQPQPGQTGHAPGAPQPLAPPPDPDYNNS